MAYEANRNGELCPACGEGHLSSHIEQEPFEYGGKHGFVAMHYSVCDRCGSELAGATESRLNKRAVNEFKKQVDGLLTGEEIYGFRKSFGLSQELAAKLFGGGKIAFSRYENDDIVQSEGMDSLIWLCLKNPYNIALLAAKKSIQLAEEVRIAIGTAVASDYTMLYREETGSTSRWRSHGKPTQMLLGGTARSAEWMKYCERNVQLPESSNDGQIEKNLYAA